MQSGTPPLQSTRIFDQVLERIRYLHYSLNIEKVYLYWSRFFIRWHGRGGQIQHPRWMGAPEIEAFLTLLATERHVSPTTHNLTHNQALSALLFLYRKVRDMDLPWMDVIDSPAQKRRLPGVMTQGEVAGLLARLLYGTGLRLMQCRQRRVKDLDFVGC